jgi:hypothetical protein
VPHPQRISIMSSLKSLSWSPVVARPPWSHPARQFAAAALRSVSAVLAHLAGRLSVPAPAPVERLPVVLEFYADAGAPEGALFMDGELVGWVPGVRRL